MIKFILPNHEQYSYKYNANISIKEILNDFCREKGLLPDIYEAYDPVKFNVLDCNKKLFEYELNSLHLRRVDSNFSSIQDSQEKLHCINTADKLWNDQTIRTYSQNSYNQIYMNNDNSGKKNKKGIISKLKKYMPKKQSITRSYSESLESPVDNKIMTLSTDKIYQKPLNNSDSIKTELEMNLKLNKKKKRIAPPPPVKDIITLYFESDIDAKSKCLDLEIPLPPLCPTEFLGNFNNYPWQSCVECCTGRSYEESIYSVILEDPFPLTVSEFRVIETPKCPTPKDISDDGTESPEQIYAKIQKKILPNFDSDNSSIETSNSYSEIFNEIGSNQTDVQIIKGNLSTDVDIDVLQIHNSPISDYIKEFSISENNKNFNAPFISTESDCSSISSANIDDILVIEGLSLRSQSQISKCNLFDPLNEITITTQILLDENQSLKIHDSNIEPILEEIEISGPLEITNQTNSKPIENNNLHLPSILISNSILPNASSPYKDKSLSSEVNELITNKNIMTEQKSNITVSNEILKSIPPKPPPKPKFYKNKIEKEGGQTNQFSPNLNNSTTSLSIKQFSNDGFMRIEKQGGSLYFSVKPKQ